MSYLSYEDSLELGAPVELYEFILGTNTWFYTSGEQAFSLGGNTYQPFPASRDRIKQSADVFKDGINLTFPRGDSFASQFLGFAPEEASSVTIRRGHWGDPSSEFIVYWKGRVSGAKADGNSVTLECESLFTSIRRPGLRARFEYTCRHVLFGNRCQANQPAFRVDDTVGSLSSGIYVGTSDAAGKPDGYYTGGMVVAPSGTSRFITGHASGILTLARPLPELALGTNVQLYPGCDHTKESCSGKFGNLPNFGGFPFIPIRNPFGGSPIV